MPALGYYNGKSPRERRATIPVQQQAMAKGAMPIPTRCSICLCTASTRAIGLHDEDYDNPLKAFPICRRCHFSLHVRFDDPERWRRLLDRVSSPDCWARNLTLDPASQWRPFLETYPKGLPGILNARI
jgi:hypothetical protein